VRGICFSCEEKKASIHFRNKHLVIPSASKRQTASATCEESVFPTSERILLFLIHRRKLFPQMLHFRRIIHRNVGIVRMESSVVLMIIFGWIKGL